MAAVLLTSEDYYIIPFYEYDSLVIFVKLKTAMNSYGALTTFSEIAENIKKFLEKQNGKTGEQFASERYARFRKF